MPALIQALKDKREIVRYNVAIALGRIGSVDVLIQALKDPDEDVRGNAVQALGKIGTPEALKAVEEYQSPQ